MSTNTPFIEVSQAIAAAGGDTIYNCKQCGLCSGLCPWLIVDSPFRTRQLIRMGQLGLEGFESNDILYACTTCNLCVLNCPRGVKIINVIRAMRAMMAESGTVPQILRTVMGSIHSKGNPWSEEREKRINWTKKLNIPVFSKDTEWFLSICCTSAFDSRSQNIAYALAKVLQAAGISFGIIGNEESCCGEALQKIGDEKQFLSLAQKNISLFRSKGIKKIITSSPHCYIAFTQEYPKIKDEFIILHYTELLTELIDKNNLKFTKNINNKIIYHDPCYLSRHAKIIEAPRKIISAIPNAKLIEFDRKGMSATCCGGGGGRLWMEVKPEQRFSIYKVREAYAKQATLLATACPYCLNMFTDSVKTENLDDKILVKDIIEIIAESL